MYVPERKKRVPERVPAITPKKVSIADAAAAAVADTATLDTATGTPEEREIEEPTSQGIEITGVETEADEIKEPTLQSADTEVTEEEKRASIFTSSCYKLSTEEGFKVWNDSHSTSSAIKCFNISFGAAVKTWGEEATKAARDELSAMLRKEVFEPAKPTTRKTIMSFMFFKPKYDANGAFQKLKARLVAGGHQQDRMLYEDVSSPTCALQSLFIVAAIAAKERRKIATMDIGTAYLNAEMERDDIHMVLDLEIKIAH